MARGESFELLSVPAGHVVRRTVQWLNPLASKTSAGGYRQEEPTALLQTGDGWVHYHAHVGQVLDHLEGARHVERARIGARELREVVVELDSSRG